MNKEEISSLKNNMVGEIYKHFKGAEYIVLDIAIHTETEEFLVVYKNFKNPDVLYARPLEMFLSKVDKVKYPDAKQEFRFEKIEG